MFSHYEMIDGDLYLYIDNSYEFGKLGVSSKIYSIKEQAVEFIKKRKIKFNKKIAYIVLNGFVIGSIFLTPGYEYKYVTPETVLSPNYLDTDITEVTKKTAPVIEELILEEAPEITVDKLIEISTDKAAAVSDTPSVPESPPVIKAPPKEVIPPAPTEQMITLHRTSGQVIEMTLEDYVVGVVAAEMPASFHTEALKSQALVSRTYALKRIESGQTITDSISQQQYKSIDEMKVFWGGSFDYYYQKVRSAVYATKGEYITYGGNYIDALYHSTSNGQTEDPIFVWGGSYSYLKNVDSHWDENVSSFEKIISMSLNAFSTVLMSEVNTDTNISVVSKTVSNRVSEISIGDNTYSGIYLRDLFGLRSTDFEFEVNEDTIDITTKGYGHGVGMSQYGADGMADSGYGYKDIVKHYYTGVSINKR